MNKKSLQIIAAVLGLYILFAGFVFAQESRKTVTVKDEDGNPVKGAYVLVGEGARPIFTNENGEFAMPSDTLVPVYIEADGYESRLIEPSASMGLEQVTLLKTPYGSGKQDVVNMPFGTFTSRRIPGAAAALSPADILRYDQTGIQGVLTGRVPGLFGSSSIRGLGEPLLVVDGIPRPFTYLNLQQVEQVTVVKDLSSALLYGSQASNGVIMVTTKRGEPLRTTLRFTAENGFSKPISYPKYLNAADYMELYNEALANDGLSPKFSAEQISNTRSATDPVRYPDEGYYNSTYLKDWTGYRKVVGEARGGNEIAQYYLNLGWNRYNGLLWIGEGENEKSDVLNMRGNIDYNITRAVSLRFDGAVIFNIARQPRYTDADFWGLSSTLHPEYYPVLIPASLITDSSLLGAVKLVDGRNVLGGTSEYLTNVYGELTRNGYRQINSRLLEMTTALDFDLEAITKGLKATVYFSFDIFSQFTADLMNTYAVYDPNYAGDSLYFTKYGVDLKVDQQTITNSTYYRRMGLFGTIDYNRKFGDHEIRATGLAYRDQYSVESVLQPARHLNFGLRANYAFKNKYIAELTGVVSGSSKLFETEPYTLSPGIGLGWVISEEGFLNDNPVISYLKIRMNWALNHSDESLTEYYAGRNLYTAGSTFYYYQGIYSNDVRYLSNGNTGLGWEKEMNFNLGFQAELLDYKVGLEASYYYYRNYDLLTRTPNSVPAYFTGLPYENYGSEQRHGIEAGLHYSFDLGEASFRIGGNLVYSVPKTLEVDELNYKDEYRSQTGKPSDAIFGYVAMGLFADQTEIDNAPQQTFGVVQPGDIRYQDLNNDNVIDNEDQKMIGNSGARLGYGLTANISYKGLELFLLADGQAGQNLIFNNPYYWVYGDRKYSEVVLNRWTPSTAGTATYPRLSSSSSANNFINSTFWLYDNNWFRLQTVQLTYALTGLNFAGLDEARFFLRGSNLLTISKIRDKTELNIGSAPQMRAVSLGLSLLF